MKCNSCGQENPEGSKFCNMCGQPLMMVQPSVLSYIQPVQQSVERHCVACGRTIDSNVNVCPYCGHDYRYQRR